MQCVGKNGVPQARGLRPLLLPFSVAAFLLWGGTPATFADTCAINNVGITTGSVINTGTINCINIQNSTVSGNVTNAAGGTINATGFFGSPTDTGIVIINNASVSGSVSNAGAITASLAGINVFAPVFGGIANSGTISAFAGIGVDASTFSGGISNSGKITTVGDAIVVGLVSTFSGGIGNTGTISAGAEGILVISDTTFSGGISNSGTISAISDGILVVGVSTYSGGIANSGTIISRDFGIDVSGGSSFSGGIANSGTISAGSNGIVVAFLSTFSGGISNSGTISAGSADGIAVTGVSSFAGNISNSGTITASTGIFIGGGVTFAAGSAILNSGTIIGTGGTAIDARFATSPLTIGQTGGLISGAIKLSANADVLNISGGTINGNIVGAGASDTINFALGSGIFTYNSAFTGINQVNINSGIVLLNGANIATNVDVNGGTLAGSGSIDPTAVTIHSGATFAPGAPGVAGTSMNIVGSLAFQSGAIYMVTLGSTTASRAMVTGTATLNGTVQGSLASGSSLSSKTAYNILHADSISGTFDGFANPNFTGSLTYTPTDVLLNVTAAALGAGAILNQNQQNVANAISNVFNSGGTLPAGFVNLFGLGGGTLANALSQLDGEVATGAGRAALQLDNQFLLLMLDPFVNGRGNASFGGTAVSFAPEQEAELPPEIALAYGSILTKAPPRRFEQRWTAWGSAYGGSSTTNGDPSVGSSNVRAGTFGFAGGMDYQFTPYTMVGFALAGAGTNWGLANAMGKGRSDALQVGAYGRSRFGPAYVAGALTFSNHWFSTSRVAFGDQLNATFTGQNFGARVEGGYRYRALPAFAVTPYGAMQVQTFHTPAYSETDVTGSGFGLNNAAMNTSGVRIELGTRFDDSMVVYGKPLTLFGRVAWAHDFVGNPTLSAAFQALPGGAFTVNGASIPRDSTLTSVGAQLFLTPQWTLLTKFEGALSSNSQTYAGAGTLRYSW